MGSPFVPPRCPHCGERMTDDHVDRCLMALYRWAAFERILDEHDRAQVAAALDNLGRQLTIAAGLTRAYRIGRVVIVDADWNRVEWHESLWTPGCGQEAP